VLAGRTGQRLAAAGSSRDLAGRADRAWLRGPGHWSRLGWFYGRRRHRLAGFDIDRVEILSELRTLRGDIRPRTSTSDITDAAQLSFGPGRLPGLLTNPAECGRTLGFPQTGDEELRNIASDVPLRAPLVITAPILAIQQALNLADLVINEPLRIGRKASGHCDGTPEKDGLDDVLRVADQVL